jgi:hypothetical protein
VLRFFWPLVKIGARTMKTGARNRRCHKVQISQEAQDLAKFCKTSRLAFSHVPTHPWPHDHRNIESRTLTARCCSQNQEAKKLYRKWARSLQITEVRTIGRKPLQVLSRCRDTGK